MPEVEDQTDQEEQSRQPQDDPAQQAPPPPASDPDAATGLPPAVKQAQNPFPDDNPQTTPPAQTDTIPEAYPAPPVILKQAPHTGFRGVLDRVLDAISGTQDSQLYTDDQGNTFVQHPPLSTGSKWARVAGILGGGAAHGLAAGRGGNIGGAAAAGFDTGMGLRTAANQADQENQVTARQMNAENLNHMILSQKIIENSLAMKRLQVQATQQDQDHEDKMIENEQKLGSIPLGTYTDAANLTEVQQKHPGIIKDFYNTKNIIAIPHVEDGKHEGVTLYLRKPQAGQQLLPPGTPYTVAELNSDTGKFERKQYTSTEPMTVDEKTSRDNAAAAAMTGQAKSDAELKQKNVETQKNQVEIDQAPLKAADLRAGINQKNAAAALDTAKAQAQRDVASGKTLPTTTDGKVDLTQVPATNVATAQRIARGDGLVQELVGRGSPAQREYWNNLVMAVDPSYTGPRTYEERVKATKDESPAGDVGKQITSFNQFLRHMQNVSDAVQNLRHGNAEWINTPMDKLSSKMSANPQLADMVPKVTAAREEMQRFLNGNHALQKEDIKAGYDMLNEHMAPSALQAAARSGALTAAERMDEINNGHRRVFNGENLPGILSPESAQSLRNFNLGSYLDRLQVLGSTNQTTNQQNNQTTNQPNTQQGTALQIQPGEHVTTNAQTKQQIVYRNNQWLDVKTGKPLQ